MGTPFLAEIRIFSFEFAPQGWARCDGQLLPINQNQALFALIGTMYGGNGQTNFALPNLRDRVPVDDGASHDLAERGGAQSHTLTQAEMPEHVHVLNATSAAASTAVPGGNLLAATAATDPLYAAPANLTALGPGSIANLGGSQPHSNLQPFLAVNFCIALQGIFPSRN